MLDMSSMHIIPYLTLKGHLEYDKSSEPVVPSCPAPVYSYAPEPFLIHLHVYTANCTPQIRPMQVVAERRKPAITAVPAAPSVAGVYAWSGGAPRAGQRCRLLYNSVSGPIGVQQGPQGGALLHLGYDGWWNQSTQVGRWSWFSQCRWGRSPQAWAWLQGPLVGLVIRLSPRCGVG